VFRRAFEHRRGYDPNYRCCLPWLFGIASNLVRDSRRRSQAYPRQLDDVAATLEVDDFAGSLSSLLDDRQLLREVVVALRRCPEPEVETLLLHVWEHLTYEEIAVALRIPVGTVRSRLNRLRARLERATTRLSAVSEPTLEGTHGN
jgi:RNA polymerase sigma-70 factor (ECF subfamily)